MTTLPSFSTTHPYRITIPNFVQCMSASSPNAASSGSARGRSEVVHSLVGYIIRNKLAEGSHYAETVMASAAHATREVTQLYPTAGKISPSHVAGKALSCMTVDRSSVHYGFSVIERRPSHELK